MINLIESCDFLSKKEYLRINSKKRYQNFFGGLISIFIISLSIFMIIYFIIDLLTNNDPRVYESKTINKAARNYKLDKKEIEFFVSLEYSNSTYYLDETVYKVSAILTEMRFVQVNGTVKQYATDKEIKMIRCSDIYSLEEIQKFNVNFPHKLFYCFPLNTTYFGGLWGSDHFNSVKIYIKKCSNKTLSNDEMPCKSIEYINSMIDYGIVSLMVSDYLVDHKNYSNPLTKYLKNNFDRLSNKNAINYLITYSNLIYKTDVGLIFNDYELNEFPIIGDFKTSYNFGEINTISFIQIQSNYFQITYIKSYVKIQDLLTKIGGVVKSLALFGMFLNYFYSYSFTTIDNVFLNHIYTFASNNKYFNKNIKKGLENNSLSKINENNKLKFINVKKIVINRSGNNNILDISNKKDKSMIKNDNKSRFENENHFNKINNSFTDNNIEIKRINIINETSNPHFNRNREDQQNNIKNDFSQNNEKRTIFRKMFEIENLSSKKNVKKNISE